MEIAPRPWNVTFLGTCSGGGPCLSRNCSSLVAEVCQDEDLWMVDCAEGTLRQFDFQPNWGGPKVSPHRVKKLFVTHMHADHTMGIVPLLRRVLYVPDHKLEAARANPNPSIEIFGPAGLRQFVRFILKATLTNIGKRYVVHELLKPTDTPTTCNPDEVHDSEVPGRDIIRGEDGFWREITTKNQYGLPVYVDAGSIEHRDPCFGYVIREAEGPRRQIVALGDTYDADGIVPLCDNPSLVIHEATDAYVNRNINWNERRTEEEIVKRALERGHSLPHQAGGFAKKVGAQGLVLNHIGSRFPTPDSDYSFQHKILREIQRQATVAWGSGIDAVVAYDYMNISIPALFQEASPSQEQASEMNQSASVSQQDKEPRKDYGRRRNHDTRRGAHSHHRENDHRRKHYGRRKDYPRADRAVGDSQES